MQYSDFVTKLATMLVVSPTQTDFVAILPACIDDAEQRIYRDLDLAATSIRNSSFSLIAGNRNLTPTGGTFVVITNVNVITPAAASTPDSGTRNPLTRVHWDWLDATYNSSSTSGLPLYWAFQDAATLAVGPWPDASYHVEIIGTQRPAALSASNTSTILTTYFPDLFLAAAMVFATGYQRNFGQASSDPQMAMSWEATYQSRLASARIEEAKKNGQVTPQRQQAG